MIRSADFITSHRARTALLVLAFALGRVHAAGAQQLGRIEGVVTDSVHSKPLSGANVYVTREGPAQPSVFRSAVSDKDGRFLLDSLVPGRYSVSISHALLDSVEIAVAPHELTLTAGATARVDFGIPSGATLRLRACPGLRLASGTGAVVGRATDAETSRPLAGATVVVGWNDIAVDRATLRATSTRRTGSARVDSAGVYRLCGVPTASMLVLQIQTNGRAGTAVGTEVPEDLGVRVLDLSFSEQSSRPLASMDAPPDSAKASATTSAEQLTGSASVTGTVRSAGGAPLSDVVLRVMDAGGWARSDSLGRFALGGLPAGTQLLEARRIGFLLGRQAVELRSGRAIDVQVRLDRIVSLDSIRVVAQRIRYKDFERHRQSSAGRFFTSDQIAERHVLETKDLFYTIPGFRVVGFGLDAQLVSTRGASPLSACRPNIVIDNMPNQEINLVRPSDIGALEVYSDAIGRPPAVNRGCGVVVIWTK